MRPPTHKRKGCQSAFCAQARANVEDAALKSWLPRALRRRATSSDGLPGNNASIPPQKCARCNSPLAPEGGYRAIWGGVRAQPTRADLVATPRRVPGWRLTPSFEWRILCNTCWRQVRRGHRRPFALWRDMHERAPLDDCLVGHADHAFKLEALGYVWGFGRRQLVQDARRARAEDLRSSGLLVLPGGEVKGLQPRVPTAQGRARELWPPAS